MVNNGFEANEADDVSPTGGIISLAVVEMDGELGMVFEFEPAAGERAEGALIPGIMVEVFWLVLSKVDALTDTEVNPVSTGVTTDDGKLWVTDCPVTVELADLPVIVHGSVSCPSGDLELTLGI